MKLYKIGQKQLLLDVDLILQFDSVAIMQQEQLSAELGTAIILATEDLFRRKFRAEPSDSRKYLPCTELLRNPNVAKLMLTYRPAHSRTPQAQVFASLVRAALKNHPLYSMATCTQQGRAEKVEVIKRKCPHEGIKNKQALIDFVFSRHRTGVNIDDELLNFSYPSVARDIENAVREGLLVRMQLIGKSPESGFLFPNLETHHFRLATSEENPFQQEYLSLCKEFRQKEERVFEESKNLEISLEVDDHDPNYQLPNFLQLKKQWKIKQTIQSLAKQEEDRKAQLKECQQNGKNARQ